MSMLAEYYKERLGKSVIERENAFAVYDWHGLYLNIAEFFVSKEQRLKGVGRSILAEIEAVAEEKGCHFVTCSVFTKALNAHESLQAILKVGFLVAGSDGQFVYLKKEIM